VQTKPGEIERLPPTPKEGPELNAKEEPDTTQESGDRVVEEGTEPAVAVEQQLEQTIAHATGQEEEQAHDSEDQKQEEYMHRTAQEEEQEKEVDIQDQKQEDKVIVDDVNVEDDVPLTELASVNEPEVVVSPPSEPTTIVPSQQTDTSDVEIHQEKQELSTPPSTQTDTPAKLKDNPYLQPSASPELFRDIFTMQKETYEKALAEKDAKLQRKLEKQKALLLQQHERELELMKQEQQREQERQEQQLLARYQSQIEQLQEERKKIAEEAQAFIDAERQKLDEAKHALADKLKELHASRLAISKELHSKLLEQKQESMALSRSHASTHKIFLALVELSTALEQHTQPFTQQLHSLQEAARGEEVIEVATDSVADLAEKGVYSYDKLKLRFHRLQKHAHRAALVPPNGGMWWHALSVIFAATSLPPSLLHLQGEQTVQILENASQKLDAGQLKDAIVEVEKLQGLPKEMAKDWLIVARARLRLDFSNLMPLWWR